MNYTNQQLEQMLEHLPDDVKDVLFGFDTGKKIREIGSKYSLHIDKLTILVDEANLVMFGITNPKDFLGIIESKLGVTHDIAGLIVHDINEQIFGSIRESLKKVHGETELVEVKHDAYREEVPQSNTIEQIILNPVDKTIFKESGVEIINEDKHVEMEENESLIREKVLNDVENPAILAERELSSGKSVPQISSQTVLPAIEEKISISKENATTPIDIVEQKLTDSFALPKKETKYQLDPYREQI